MTCYHVINEAGVRIGLIDSLNVVLPLIYKATQYWNQKHVAKSTETMHRSDIVNCRRIRNNASNDRFQSSKTCEICYFNYHCFYGMRGIWKDVIMLSHCPSQKMKIVSNQGHYNWLLKFEIQIISLIMLN